MSSNKFYGNSAQNMLNSQLAIRQEIQRFESVHPSIYAIYDLIELIPDPTLSQSIRDHVVCIEGKIQNYIIIIINFFVFCPINYYEMQIMRIKQIKIDFSHFMINTRMTLFFQQ